VIFRSRKLLNYAKESPCIRCGREDGTIVAAHYSGRYSQALGKGCGHKPHDSACAHLCGDCHTHFDSYSTPNDDTRAAEFLLLIVKTTAQLLIDGHMEVK